MKSVVSVASCAFCTVLLRTTVRAINPNNRIYNNSSICLGVMRLATTAGTPRISRIVMILEHANVAFPDFTHSR